MVIIYAQVNLLYWVVFLDQWYILWFWYKSWGQLKIIQHQLSQTLNSMYNGSICHSFTMSKCIWKLKYNQMQMNASLMSFVNVLTVFWFVQQLACSILIEESLIVSNQKYYISCNNNVFNCHMELRNMFRISSNWRQF